VTLTHRGRRGLGETGPESEQARATSAHTRVQRDRTRGASYHSGPYDKKRPGTNGPRANLISLENGTTGPRNETARASELMGGP
jgi:hypothetical protein